MSPHAHKNSPFLSVLLVLLLFFSFRWAESVNPFACDTANKVTKSLTFCNASLPIPDRVKDLIGRLTLKEKISLLVDKAAPVQRLTVNGYNWWSEALHGVSDWGRGTQFGGAFPGATSFPQVITTAAAFNSCLWEDIGRVVSDEARAMHNAGKAGLTFWSPNVNIFRDPRWGRGQETPGEDPFVVSEFGISYVRGLQGYTEGSGPLKVAACCKHYTAYDLDKWNGVDRFHFNAQVSQQDLEETYNVPFEQCVKEGNVACVMCSYNQVNDKPTCADPDLLRGTIRGQWNLNGYIVSDCDSVAVLYNQQHYAKTREDAVAMTIKAGLNLDCGEFLGRYTENAIRQTKLSEIDVNGALTNTFTVQMRLGMFDGDPSKQQYGHLGPKDVCTQDHSLLALDAARQGIVLLKNLNQSLPLSTTKYRSIAVIGPNANVTVTMIGNYFGDPCNFTTALQGIGSYAKTNYEQGCAGVQCKDNRQFRVAEAVARGADATVLVMGLDQAFEREGFDRTNLFLPGRQQELVLRVAKASRGPTILVLMSGGPIDVSFAKDDPLIVAILWVGYPGQAGGAAIADILFGKTIPDGRLPMTWYLNSYLAQAPMTDMNMRPNKTTGYPGRTYKFYNGTVLYAFGDGLSYTTFTYSLVHAPTSLAVPLFSTTLDDSENSQASRSSHVRVSHANCAGLSLSLHLDLKNTGTFDGSHTVLAFATVPALAGKQGPMKQLVAFEKVHVVAASQRRVQMNVDVCKHLSVVDELGVRRIPMGEHTLHIGDLKHSVSLQTILNQIKT